MRTRDRVALVAIAATLVLAGVLLGGATRWAACAVALVAIGSALPHVTARRTSSRHNPLVILIAIAVAATALQLVPLPEAIAELAAPDKLALVRDHARALGQPPPRWVVASHDAPTTVVELAKLVGYLALAWGATRVASQRRARPYLAAAAVAGAAAVALVVLGHRVIGATRIYGVFVMPADQPPSPLVNENHLASLTAMVVPLAVGLGLFWRGSRRVAMFAAALLLAGTALLTASRGGAVGLAAGVVVAIIVLVAQRRAGVVDDDRRAPPSVTVSTFLVAACVVTLFTVVAARDVARELGKTELSEFSARTSKYQVWRDAAPMIVDNRWLGIGRGSFELAFTRRSEISEVTFSHVENSYLQAAVDWGVPAALAMLLALAALGRAALRRWRYGPIEAGAIGALAAVAIHDVADFSLEMPVVAMTSIAVAALLVPSRLGTGEDPKAAVARAVLGRRGGALAAGLIVIVIAALPVARSARVDRDRLPPVTRPDAVAAATAALERHPADALTAGRLAAALYERRDPRAPAMIGRALYLRPSHGGLHLIAARMLVASQRRGQAPVEYAHAIAGARDVVPIIDEVLARVDGVAAQARSLPDDPRQVWRVAGALVARQRYDVSYAYTARVIASDASAYPAQYHHALAAYALGRYDDALAAAQVAHRLEPTASTALILARSLDRLARRSEAIALLVATRASTDAQTAEIAVTLAGLQRQGGDLAAARATLGAAAQVLVDAPKYEAQMHRWLAEIEAAQGRANAAAWERNRARELDPAIDSEQLAPR